MTDPMTVEQIAERLHESYCDDKECTGYGKDCGMTGAIVYALHAARAEALRDAFLAGFQAGINSVDRNGESDADPEDELADWLRSRAVEEDKAGQ